ncbi:MAG TPA: GMC family oxidoreductase [Cyclobacteriaceae bacterium]|nr:GMC family oxidoreductase [Cyclobacteriaceae bacterium]HMV07682.1 GMC family oxidoreductase [Cyclobacteriaceae bacterium]HMV88483.1 GMC family oxidoreductase [Cyclobacteriaceae bacterium]HMW98817.1 GMC family oxidoreductase [Cyclobacteriaceae bacterium]HMX48550.1 GMC family oxidoreductase [Cyclobacteriaceae bacterium]
MLAKTIQVNSGGKEKNTYDAIVIGSGISGGWATKELCELGLKTLVLERGRDVQHLKDYPTMMKKPWELPHRGRMSNQFLKENPLISKAAGFGEDTAHFFIEDKDHPYVQDKPFDWIRGYQLGGKSLIWGRACQRWSKYEFEAPAKLGYGIDWPIRYEDVAPWYSHVEKFIGVCGNKDGIESMPDGEFLPPFEFNCVEKHVKQTLLKEYKNRFLVQGRWAHLSQPNEIHLKQGRGQCQARNLCMRGCPYGSYFSSNSTTLPWAAKTGNLTMRPFSVVHSIIYDELKEKATGVRIIDSKTKEVTEYFSRIIFLNASALNSNLVLLNSTSNRFPNGLGNDNDTLGKYIGFHLYRGFVNASFEGFTDKYYYVRNPTEGILANYRNLGKQEMDYVGGFTTFSAAYRTRASQPADKPQLGADYKDAISKPGPWEMYMYMQGETVPKKTNHVRLSETEKDQWGIPLLVTSVGYDDNDEKMVKDFLEQSQEMLTKAGGKILNAIDNKQPPGLDIHEMGGVRMGRDPKTSMLNQWNQLHHCKNVFVTDGACMTSTGNQSPSILYMTLTARAANHAVEEMKKGNL